MTAAPARWLVVRGGPDQGLAAEITNDLLVGRDASCDVVLRDERVSRRHAYLRPTLDGLVLQDLGSTNGTFVDGQKLEGQVTLQGTEELRFGDTVATIKTDGSEATRIPDRRVGTTIGRYRIIEPIAAGNMSIVYLAEHTRTGRQVALKLLSPELFRSARSRERFLAECRAAGSLEHRNIIPIYDADEVGDDLYLAMQFVRGSDLSTMIGRDGPLQPQRAIDIIGQIAEALDVAHGAGLVHRDVKPGNILVTSAEDPLGPDHAFLCDFGITKDIVSDQALTNPGQALGTRAYMAPEQFRGDPVDARTDVYALGCVLFEALTGQRPFPLGTEDALMYAHLETQPPNPSTANPNLPGNIDLVIATALAKRPDARYPTCVALIEASREALSHQPPAAPAPAQPTFADAPTAGSTGETLADAAGTGPAPATVPDLVLVGSAETLADVSASSLTPPDQLPEQAPSTVPDGGSDLLPPGSRRRTSVVVAIIIGATLVTAITALLVIARSHASADDAAEASGLPSASITPPAGGSAIPTSSPPQAPEPPKPPEVQQVREVKAISVGSTTVTLSWRRPFGVAQPSRYLIMRDGIQVGATKETGYTDSGLSSNTTYHYRVVAVARDSQATSEPLEVITALPPPPPGPAPGTQAYCEQVIHGLWLPATGECIPP